MTISHEKIAPLRNIVTLAESIMAKTFPDMDPAVSNIEKREISLSEVKMLWSQAKMISLQVESQATNNKILMGHHMFYFKTRKNIKERVA